jgi:hypothetical protein
MSPGVRPFAALRVTAMASVILSGAKNLSEARNLSEAKNLSEESPRPGQTIAYVGVTQSVIGSC